jgi:hypothetical protein
MELRVKKGLSVQAYFHGQDPRTVRIAADDEGFFSWTDEKEEQNDRINMADIHRIGEGMSPDASPDGDTSYSRKLFVLTADDQVCFEFNHRRVRDDWLLALRYATRNIKELGMLSRSPGDPARNNSLAAKLRDKLDDLEKLYQKALKDLAEKERSTKAHIEEMDRVVRDKDNQINAATAKISQLEDSIRQRAALEEDRLKAAMEKFQNAESRETAIQEQYSKMTETVRVEKDQQIAEIKEQMASLRLEYAETQKEHKATQQQIQALTLEKVQTSASLAHAEANVERLRKEKKESSEENRELASRLDKLRSDKREIEYARDDLRANVQRKDQEIKRANDRADALRTQMDEAERTKAQLERWKSTHEHSEESNKRMFEDRESRLKTELKNVEERAERHAKRQEDEITRLLEKCKEFEAKERQNIMMEMDRLRLQAQAPQIDPKVTERLRALEKREIDLMREKSEIDLKNQATQYQNSVLKTSVDDLTAAKAKLQQKVRQLEEEVDTQSRRANRGDPQIQQKLQGLQEKNRKLKEDLGKVRQEERTAAIQSCAKMMTHERKKTAKLIQISRNFKKKSTDLENALKSLFACEQKILPHIPSLRTVLSEVQLSGFEQDMEALQKALADSSEILFSGKVDAEVKQAATEAAQNTMRLQEELNELKDNLGGSYESDPAYVEKKQEYDQSVLASTEAQRKLDAAIAASRDDM